MIAFLVTVYAAVVLTLFKFGLVKPRPYPIAIVKVQLLFPSEPCKSLKPRSLYMVILVEKDVRVERRRTCDCLKHEEFYWQYEVCTCTHQKHRNAKLAFGTCDDPAWPSEAG